MAVSFSKASQVGSLAVTSLLAALSASPALSAPILANCDFVRDCEPVSGVRFENCTSKEIEVQIRPEQNRLTFGGAKFELANSSIKNGGERSFLATRGSEEVLVTYDSSGANMFYWKDKHEDLSFMHYGRCTEVN
ncbi:MULTISPECIES: hypothetical protein [unclassified Leisingera]|uniref:hypothetical protein n=1 Tax=unclassified Leisingera TaxID=2614906 RepID=UPI0005629381|nr:MULTISPECIES: hypothetical protein [unclassified Leisingera]KIC25186.1 hypothetical protein RA23_04710 [Leisingera sp. ANG-S3]KIC54761.1 hypothetical protein RA22_05340 [Leisingera sp. ANG-S]KID10472.1 hypothetical protein GC1_01930 [Leisingera sp. ANG1]